MIKVNSLSDLTKLINTPEVLRFTPSSKDVWVIACSEYYPNSHITKTGIDKHDCIKFNGRLVAEYFGTNSTGNYVLTS